MSINKNYDFLIVGGGMVGMVMALALEKSGFQCLILEKASPPLLTKKRYDGRNTALNRQTVSFFQSLDIWEALQPFCQPIEDIIVSDGTVRRGASSSFLTFSADLLEEGPLGYFVQNPDLREVLIKAIEKKAQTITVLYDQTIQKIEHPNDSTVCIIANETEYSSKILIAADGRDSYVRTLCNIQTVRKEYNQKGIVTTIAHSLPHEGIAQEFFLPAGPFAMLPLCGNQTSLVWTEKTEVADAFIQQPQEVIAYEIHRRFGDSLGEIHMKSNLLAYPLRRQKADKLYHNRVVLIGDAAHSIHPIAGQGFNLSLRGVRTLLTLLQAYQEVGLDLQQALPEYESKRHADIFILSEVTEKLDRLFSNDHPFVTCVRRMGLELLDGIPSVKKFFIRQVGGRGEV